MLEFKILFYVRITTCVHIQCNTINTYTDINMTAKYKKEFLSVFEGSWNYERHGYISKITCIQQASLRTNKQPKNKNYFFNENIFGIFIHVL